jgi:hypothetical protein
MSSPFPLFRRSVCSAAAAFSVSPRVRFRRYLKVPQTNPFPVRATRVAPGPFGRKSHRPFEDEVIAFHLSSVSPMPLFRETNPGPESGRPRPRVRRPVTTSSDVAAGNCTNEAEKVKRRDEAAREAIAGRKSQDGKVLPGGSRTRETRAVFAAAAPGHSTPTRTSFLRAGGAGIRTRTAERSTRPLPQDRPCEGAEGIPLATPGQRNDRQKRQAPAFPKIRDTDGGLPPREGYRTPLGSFGPACFGAPAGRKQTNDPVNRLSPASMHP